MKVILDTNVVVSGIFFAGVPFEILRAVKKGKCRSVISADIVEEYKRTINKLANNFPAVNAEAQLELFILSSEICQTENFQGFVCADRDDDKFIACAVAGKTKIIVSGDKHLLNVSGYHGIKIIKPKHFLEKYL